MHKIQDAFTVVTNKFATRFGVVMRGKSLPFRLLIGFPIFILAVVVLFICLEVATILLGLLSILCVIAQAVICIVSFRIEEAERAFLNLWGELQYTVRNKKDRKWDI